MADGAIDTRLCHDAIAARGAAAIIPPCKNAKAWAADTAKTKMRGITLPGQRLTAGDFDLQVAEFLIRVPVLNG